MNNASRLPPQQCSEHGFTMIEMLISLTILGFIMALMASAITLVSRSWDVNSERLERMESVSRTAQLFRRDIESLRRYATDGEKKPAYIFSGQSSELSFISIEPPYPSTPGPYFIKYGPSEDDPGKGLQRSRAPYEDGAKDFPGATPTNRVDILDGNFEFRFFYGALENDGVRWTDSWTDPEKLPSLIRLQLTDKNQNNPIILSQIIARVRINAEQNCIIPGSKKCSIKKVTPKKKDTQKETENSSGNQTPPPSILQNNRPSP